MTRQIDEDTCYYCGEPYEEGEECSELDGKPHESQREFDAQMKKLEAAKRAQLDDLTAKFNALKPTSDGCKL